MGNWAYNPTYRSYRPLLKTGFWAHLVAAQSKCDDAGEELVRSLGWKCVWKLDGSQRRACVSKLRIFVQFCCPGYGWFEKLPQSFSHSGFVQGGDLWVHPHSLLGRLFHRMFEEESLKGAVFGLFKNVQAMSVQGSWILWRNFACHHPKVFLICFYGGDLSHMRQNTSLTEIRPRLTLEKSWITRFPPWLFKREGN